MERLTGRNSDGGAFYKNCFREDKCRQQTTREKCVFCKHEYSYCEKLAEYEDTEEQGLLIRLPQSDWKHLIEEINVIVTNDFIVHQNGIEFIITNIWMLDDDEEFRFDARCRYCYREDGYWECNSDEECDKNQSDEGYGCIISFTFYDIGKTVFLTKEEAEAALAEMNNMEV